MNPTQHNLLAQMQINTLEIGRRKALLEFGAQDEALLAACRAMMAGEVDALVAAFYARRPRSPKWPTLSATGIPSPA